MPTGASAGSSILTYSAQGLYQGKDSAGNPVAYKREGGDLYQYDPSQSDGWAVTPDDQLASLLPSK